MLEGCRAHTAKSSVATKVCPKLSIAMRPIVMWTLLCLCLDTSGASFPQSYRRFVHQLSSLRKLRGFLSVLKLELSTGHHATVTSSSLIIFPAFATTYQQLSFLLHLTSSLSSRTSTNTSPFLHSSLSITLSNHHHARTSKNTSPFLHSFLSVTLSNHHHGRTYRRHYPEWLVV